MKRMPGITIVFLALAGLWFGLATLQIVPWVAFIIGGCEWIVFGLFFWRQEPPTIKRVSETKRT